MVILLLALNPVPRTLDITISAPASWGGGTYTTQVVYDAGDYTPGDVLGWRRGGVGRMYIDNFTVQQEIPAIPEPAGLGLIGLALIGLPTLVRPRRRA